MGPICSLLCYATCATLDKTGKESAAWMYFTLLLLILQVSQITVWSAYMQSCRNQYHYWGGGLIAGIPRCTVLNNVGQPLFFFEAVTGTRLSAQVSRSIQIWVTDADVSKNVGFSQDSASQRHQGNISMKRCRTFHCVLVSNNKQKNIVNLFTRELLKVPLTPLIIHYCVLCLSGTWYLIHVVLHAVREQSFVSKEGNLLITSPLVPYCLIKLQFKSLWKETESQSYCNITQALREAYSVLSHCQQEAPLERLKIWQSMAEQRAHSKCILWLFQLQIEFQGMTWLKTPNNPTSLAVLKLNKVTL